MQVSALVQCATGLHSGHDVCAAERYRPEAHALHVELEAVVQVSGETQPAMGVQALQAVGTPVLRQYPAAHAEQVVFDAEVHVCAPTQLLTGVHC